MSKQTDLINVTDAITVDGSNVGIGTSSPTKLMHLKANSPAINLHSDNASSAQISFTNSGGVSEQGFIKYEHSGDYAGSMQFRTSGSERMRIDTSGRVTKPYQPSFRAYSPVSGSGSVNSTIVWSSTYHNIGNHFNTSTGVFTAPVAGVYAFTANVLIRYGGYHRIEYEINGARSTRHGETLEDQAGPSYSSPSFSVFIKLSAGDTLSVFNGPTEVFGSLYGAFSGILIG
jgi:hypothetical protein